MCEIPDACISVLVYCKTMSTRSSNTCNNVTRRCSLAQFVVLWGIGNFLAQINWRQMGSLYELICWSNTILVVLISNSCFLDLERKHNYKMYIYILDHPANGVWFTVSIWRLQCQISCIGNHSINLLDLFHIRPCPSSGINVYMYATYSIHNPYMTLYNP